MASKCGNCDLTNREVPVCSQCLEFQKEINENVLRSGRAYERLFKQQKRESNGGQ